MNDNLVVYDEEFEAFSNTIVSIGKQAEANLKLLIEQLNVVAEAGISEGSVHNNLVTFISALQNMHGQLSSYTNALGQDVINYLNEVEVRDFSFYEGGRVDGWN